MSPHKLGPLLVDCSMLIHVGIGDGMIAHWYVRAHRNIDIYTYTLYIYMLTQTHRAHTVEVCQLFVQPTFIYVRTMMCQANLLREL